MTITTPDINTISQAAIAAIQSRLQRDATLPRSPLKVIAKTVSGAADGIYEAVDSAASDIIYDTASEDALVRWAGIWGLTRKAPTPAKGIVVFTGGTGTIPAGTLVARADGIQYAVDLDIPLIGNTGAGTVTCLSAGAMTNVDDGTNLTLVQPVEGVASSVTCSTGGLSDGNDIEKIEELLARLLERIRQTPPGGAGPDYEEWALAVAGVTRVWVKSGWNGPGTVGVLFMCDDRANPIPQTADVTAVQTAIDAVRPVSATTYAVAPTAAPLNFSIQLLPDSAAARTAVQAELQELITTTTEPGGTTLLSQLRAAISAAAGVTDYMMPTPAANVTAAAGSITTMGVITWL
jgi:uncharacterized phage protein gp47/JayE